MLVLCGSSSNAPIDLVDEVIALGQLCVRPLLLLVPQRARQLHLVGHDRLCQPGDGSKVFLQTGGRGTRALLVTLLHGGVPVGGVFGGSEGVPEARRGASTQRARTRARSCGGIADRWVRSRSTHTHSRLDWPNSLLSESVHIHFHPLASHTRDERGLERAFCNAAACGGAGAASDEIPCRAAFRAESCSTSLLFIFLTENRRK